MNKYIYLGLQKGAGQHWCVFVTRAAPKMATASFYVPRVGFNCFPPLQETLLEQQIWLRKPWKISASQDGESRCQITREGKLQLAKPIWTVMWVKSICLLNEGIISELTDWNVSKCQEQKSTRFLQSFGKDGELLDRKFFSLQTTGLDSLALWWSYLEKPLFFCILSCCPPTSKEHKVFLRLYIALWGGIMINTEFWRPCFGLEWYHLGERCMCIKRSVVMLKKFFFLSFIQSFVLVLIQLWE